MRTRILLAVNLAVPGMAMLMALTCLDLRMAYATTPEERESLRGLQGVEVIIEDIVPDAKKDGLSEEAIRTTVELILRSNRIPVLTTAERERTPSGAFLAVEVSLIKNKGAALYAGCITVSLQQLVQLVHLSGEKRMVVRTWETSSTVSVGPNYFREIINSGIEPQVKEFANDFLAVNHR